ncbi:MULTISPECIES: nucleobase:cation symporter-2 family protein [Fusobacterium]|jgi:xanthine permease|uniref:Purine permease n=1 Tax=Fusobacterium hominis TaxID=2764326 RepID=A0A7G9GWG7_9FUSO|nr:MULTISPECIES: nucleobase:cation symporter-2 family protein [Fusobacterium]QNM15149.1 purine permease [Fusobacterium hominis]
MTTTTVNEKHKVDRLLGFGDLALLGIQHIAAMCAGAMAVPIILGNSLGLSQGDIHHLVSASFMMAGLGTIIQTIGIKGHVGAKLPMIEGVSFAGVAALSAIGLTYSGTDPIAGLQVMFGATLVSGLFCYLMAPVFGKLLKYFPPLVSGVVVTSMGLSLIPVAIRWAGGGVPSAPNFGNFQNISLALITLIIIIGIQKLSKGFLGNVAILIGIFAGTIISLFMGVADFSNVGNVDLVNINIPLKYGIKFDVTAILSLFLVQLVIMTDATGNQLNLSNICGVDEKDSKRLVAGLRGHGISSMLAGIFNTFPHSLFGQNVGIAAITGIESRFVGTSAGIILLAISFFPKLTTMFASIPSPVLGGAGIVMFGMVTANGIKRLGEVNYVGNKNLIIVATSIGMALIPIAVPDFFKHFPAWGKILFQSAVTLGCLTVLILNLIFNEYGKNKK